MGLAAPSGDLVGRSVDDPFKRRQQYVDVSPLLPRPSTAILPCGMYMSLYALARLLLIDFASPDLRATKASRSPQVQYPIFIASHLIPWIAYRCIVSYRYRYR